MCINSKEEFLEEIGARVVLCVEISFGAPYSAEPRVLRLPVGFSPDQLESLLSQLDLEYDNGYGGQQLYGFIWYQDGTWSERGEYDGSEWWEHKVCPDIPAALSPSPVKEGA